MRRTQEPGPPTDSPRVQPIPAVESQRDLPRHSVREPGVETGETRSDWIRQSTDVSIEVPLRWIRLDTAYRERRAWSDRSEEWVIQPDRASPTTRWLSGRRRDCRIHFDRARSLSLSDSQVQLPHQLGNRRTSTCEETASRSGTPGSSSPSPAEPLRHALEAAFAAAAVQREEREPSRAAWTPRLYL